jgi:hypothetical protein
LPDVSSSSVRSHHQRRPARPKRLAPRPTDTRGRRISEEIRVHYHARCGLFEARLKTKQPYSHPEDAPDYARLKFYRGQWLGDVEIADFAEDEVSALRQLAKILETLDDPGLTDLSALTSTIGELERHAAARAARGATRKAA